MYENSNKEIINEVAAGSFHVHKMRNIIGILAIALTTILITIVCTVGVSFFQTYYASIDMSPGPGADSRGIIGSDAQYEQVKKLEQVEWAVIARPCSNATIRNKEMLGLMVNLLAVDEEYYGVNYIELISGKMPAAANEMLLSDTMAKHLKLSGKPGEQMTLNVVLTRDGKEVTEPIVMTITGYYRNPLYNITDYEEIYTVKDFLNVYNPELPTNKSTIYTKLKDVNFLTSDSEVHDRLTAINETVGGLGTTMKTAGDITGLLIPIILLTAVIMGSGYFLIYNVFYISILKDIQFYGMLKTIGTTRKQMKTLLRYQVTRLAAVGIGIGLVAGFLLGTVMSPMIVTFTEFGEYYETSFLPLIFVLAILFSALTVIISCRKPFKIAAKISPIEAVRYSGKTKKGIFSVVSLALSGIIFLVVFNVTIGYDINTVVDKFNHTDFKITHNHALYQSAEAYLPISQELPGKIGNLPFVKSCDTIYQARTMPDKLENGNTKDSAAEVKAEGKIQEDRIAALGAEREKTFINERGNYDVAILGIPPQKWEQESKHAKVCSGEFNEEKFASGDYVIYQNLFGSGDESTIQPEETLKLSIYDERKGYIEKEFKVLAVIESTTKQGAGNISYSELLLPDTLFKELFPEYPKQISGISIQTIPGDSAKQKEEIKKVMLEEYNSQITLDSKYDTRNTAENNKIMMLFIGLFFAGLFGFIGISNVVNTLVTDILARKIEFAGLQSIGMTKGQMRKMLTMEGFKLALAALVVMIPAGGVIAVKVGAVELFTGFSITAFMISCALVIAVVSGVVLAVAGVMTRILNEKSIVERLREG